MRQHFRRQEFLGLLASISADKRLWVDECGVEEEAERPYGRALKRKRVYSERSGKIRHARTTVIAAYRQKKIEAPFRFKGHTNTAVFNAWVGQCFVPVLKKDDWVILDNGAFHKSPQTRKAIEEQGVHLLFLPPYSPDLNEIEPQWANLKARIRKDKYSNQTSCKISIIISYIGKNIKSISYNFYCIRKARVSICITIAKKIMKKSVKRKDTLPANNQNFRRN